MLSNDPTYPLFPTLAFLGFVVSLIPLPWHIHAWNSGTCAYMFWTATACLLSFINALVWKGNAINVAPVWCDISSKLLLGVGIGIPASGLCIARRLYKITSMRSVSITRQDKIRAIAIDLAIAIGIPILVMILHVVVQPHRFDILEDVGCYAVVYITMPAYFLFFMWPLVLGTISFVFSALCLRAFYIRRLQFAQILAHNKSLDTSRYMRLMLLAILDMCCTIPIGALSIYFGTHGVEVAPWISWADTHWNFGHVNQIPAIIWRSNPAYERSVEMTRWLPVACAFLFFGLFGFASEAQRYYKAKVEVVAKKVGVSDSKLRGFKLPHPKWNDSKDAKGGLPVYASPAKDSADGVFAARKKELYGTPTTDTFLSSTVAHTDFTRSNSTVDGGAGQGAFGGSKQGAFGGSKQGAFGVSKGSLGFDPEKGVPLPSSPATSAPPPEYEFHERDLPDVPVNVGRLSIDFQVVSPSSASSSSSSDSSPSHSPRSPSFSGALTTAGSSSALTSSDSPSLMPDGRATHRTFDAQGALMIPPTWRGTVNATAEPSFPPPPRVTRPNRSSSLAAYNAALAYQPSQSSLRSQTLPHQQLPHPSPHPSIHQPSHTSLRSQAVPQHQRSQSSLRSLATSLASSGADVIYIYDAYQDDEEVGRRESLPPFSNLEPAPAPAVPTTTTATPTLITDADEACQPAHSAAARQARYSRRPATPLPPLFVTRRTEEA